MFDGRRLKAERKRAGLTQAELASKSGCEVNTISRIELGHFRPRHELRSRLAKALELDELALESDDGASEPAGHLSQALSTDEKMLLDVWRQLDVIQKVEVMKTASAFLSSKAIGNIADELLGQAGPAPGAERKGTRP